MLQQLLISAMSPLVMLILQVLVADLHALPAAEKYEIVVPRQLHAEYKSDTQDKYPQVAKYELHIEETPLVLYLERNEDLIGDNYRETSYDQDGTPIMRTPKENIKDHCHYHGYVENDSQSVASISTCSGLSGFIITEGRKFLIKPKDQNSKEHVVYEENEPPRTCGTTNEPLVESMMAEEALPLLDNIKEKIGNLQKEWKYIEMYITCDKSLFDKFKRNATNVKNRIYEIVNNMNMVFKAINTSVTLVGMEIWEDKDQVVVGSSINDCLSNFSKWRMEKLLPRVANDNAQLFTAIDFDGPAVGLANVAVMCSERYSAGVIQDYSESAVFVGATASHEVSHNMGMNHDNKNCSCNGTSCIMTPVLSRIAPNLFSKCSLDEFKTFLVNKVPTCLLNKPNKETIITPPVCGNKLIEMGEQCDCGTAQECTNPCCDALKCKLKQGAVCADGECCEKCQIKKEGSVCRPSLHDCDLPDTCDGKSSRCLNLFKEDGISCNDGHGYCFHGKCPTLENQCTALWGSSALVASDGCFFINTKGKSYGYCTEMKGDYQACPPQDVKCGMLFCSGGLSYPLVSAPTAQAGKCRAVLHPSGKVQEGIKCADGKVCYKGRCQSKDLAYEPLSCFGECPGQVKCDKKGQCYCDEDQILPRCTTPIILKKT